MRTLQPTRYVQQAQVQVLVAARCWCLGSFIEHSVMLGIIVSLLLGLCDPHSLVVPNTTALTTAEQAAAFTAAVAVRLPPAWA